MASSSARRDADFEPMMRRGVAAGICTAQLRAASSVISGGGASALALRVSTPLGRRATVGRLVQQLLSVLQSWPRWSLLLLKPSDLIPQLAIFDVEFRLGVRLATRCLLSQSRHLVDQLPELTALSHLVAHHQLATHVLERDRGRFQVHAHGGF